MELLIVIASCFVFPLVIGYIYGRNQEPPAIDPDFYYVWNKEN